MTVWVLAGAGAAGAGLGLVVWLRRRLVVITVQGGSMRPTYRTGDRVLVRRAGLSQVRRGEVVVVQQPVLDLPPTGTGMPWPPTSSERPRALLHATGRAPLPVRGELDHQPWMIKRAVALPGDPVPAGLRAAPGVTPGTRVPAGCLLVLGDNPDASLDSRGLGYLAGESVLGVVLRTM